MDDLAAVLKGEGLRGDLNRDSDAANDAFAQ